jgi:hypothetical protein
MGGHTTPTMAIRYQQVASEHMAEVMDRLGSFWSPGTA